jgi:hypothetical protein
MKTQMLINKLAARGITNSDDIPLREYVDLVKVLIEEEMLKDDYPDLSGQIFILEALYGIKDLENIKKISERYKKRIDELLSKEFGEVTS